MDGLYGDMRGGVECTYVGGAIEVVGGDGGVGGGLVSSSRVPVDNGGFDGLVGVLPAHDAGHEGFDA